MAGNASSYKYGVYIVYETNDEDRAEQIGKALENKGIKVVDQTNFEAFRPGAIRLKSTVDCVNNSERTLLILTPKALESQRIVLEILHAIDQSKRCNVLTLRLLLIDVNEDHLAKYKRGIVATLQPFWLDLKKDNWEEVLEKNIKKEIPLSKILPLEGSPAHGLVFSHFAGFLSHVLPGLKEQIEESDIFKRKPQLVSTKYYILFPESCKTINTLEGYDDQNQIRIEWMEERTFQKDHAGKPRTFKLSIYKISKKTQEGSECYYFFADNPYVLNAMSTMREMGLGEVDMCLQVEQFIRVLEDVVNHAQNVQMKACYDTVRIIRYKDNDRTMQEALFQEVQANMAQESKEKVPDTSNGAENENPNKGEETACDAFITYLGEDSKVFDEIQRYLKSHNVTVHELKAGQKIFKFTKANWYIFVLSKEAVKENSLVLYKYFMLLHEGVCKNELQVLLVIVDIKPEEIPHYIKWVTMVYAEEPRYCEKLHLSMKGGRVRFEHRLPCGDVAIGLAWAYVINYLRITLLCRSKLETGNLDLSGRIRKFLGDKGKQCGCILKMFPVLPKSCTLEDELHKKANEGLVGKEVVKNLGMLEPVYQNTGGQLGRPFYLHVYMHTDPVTQKSVCFVAEYFTPGHCLNEMAHSYSFAGLHKEDMLSQGERIVSLVPDFLKREYVKQKLGDMTGLVKIIYYDDTKETGETLLLALERHILKETHDMVYASDDAQQNRVSRDDN